METIPDQLTSHLDAMFLLVIILLLYLYTDWKNERQKVEQNKRIDGLYNLHIDFLQRKGQQTFKWKE